MNRRWPLFFMVAFAILLFGWLSGTLEPFMVLLVLAFACSNLALLWWLVRNGKRSKAEPADGGS
jgi:hypothetical protein